MAEYRYNLRGEIDLATAPKLRADLKQVLLANHSDVLIDCTGLAFIDSTGIAVLLEANRDLEDQGRHMLIVNVAPSPRRSFEILGLLDLLRYDRASL